MRTLSMVALALWLAACGAPELTSSPASSKSHNGGKGCLDCHKLDGAGKGEFELAGSAWELDGETPHLEVTAMVHTAPEGGGELIAAVEADRKGNFYTTDAIIWEEGLYVSIVGRLGVRYMKAPVPDGGCNGCHDGEDQARLTVD